MDGNSPRVYSVMRFVFIVDIIMERHFLSIDCVVLFLLNEEGWELKEKNGNWFFY